MSQTLGFFNGTWLLNQVSSVLLNANLFQWCELWLFLASYHNKCFSFRSSQSSLLILFTGIPSCTVFDILLCLFCFHLFMMLFLIWWSALRTETRSWLPVVFHKVSPFSYVGLMSIDGTCFCSWGEHWWEVLIETHNSRQETRQAESLSSCSLFAAFFFLIWVWELGIKESQLDM